MQETVYAFGIFILFFLVGFADGFLEFLMRLHAKLCSTGDGMPRAQVCVCYYYLYLFFLAIFRYFALRLFANFVSLLMRKKPKKIRKKLKKSQILCIKFCVFSSYYEGFQHSSVWYVLSNTSTAKRDLIPITLLLSCYCLLLAFE